MAESTTNSNTENLDGSTQEQNVSVNYSYDNVGRLTGAAGSGSFTADDGYGNKTTGTIDQSYDVVIGQAKMAESTTNSNTENLDGSTQEQNVSVDYSYDNVGRLTGAAGSGSFTADDGYGNKTTGTIDQSYDVVIGQAKMAESTTNSNTENLDGSTQEQNVSVDYSYDNVGRLTGADGSGSFTADDGYGNKTTGNIDQSYDVVIGQAKMAESTTNSNTANLDGSTQQQNVSVDYSYDNVGRLTGADGSGSFTADDGYGNKTTGNIDQSYDVVIGQAKMAESTTNSNTANLDGSTQEQNVSVDYSYDNVG